ncbi:MAG TPA: L-threonylcarbamoyladenylate synthase [Deltaproteobacteria bacterium]|nr:L-threonylcarbamoyladenylate synthase [Deltaproteobacteria bacterium]
MRIQIDPMRPKPRTAQQVAEILKDGGIVVYPTDTVYALGFIVSNKHGLDRISQIKASVKPKSIIFADIKDISEYAKVSNEAYRLMRLLFPGPYTLILPATRHVPRLLQSKRKSIGVRIPDHWFCRELVSQIGEPIITTSIPLTDDQIHIDPIEIEVHLGNRVEAIVDSGILPDIPSTVVSLETDSPEIVRYGLGPTDIFEAA